MWYEQEPIPNTGETNEQILKRIMMLPNPFRKDAAFQPTQEMESHLVYVPQLFFLTSDSPNIIPATGDMAPCVAVGLFDGNGKAAVAHFMTHNKALSIADILESIYPGVDPKESGKNVRAVMRGGLEDFDSSQRIAADLVRAMELHGITIVGAEIMHTPTLNAFAIYPPDGRILINTYTDVRAVQKKPTPVDYDQDYLKPVLEAMKPI